MAYMPTAEEWPKGGYEVENSPFGQGAAETLIGENLENPCVLAPKLIQRLARFRVNCALPPLVF